MSWAGDRYLAFQFVSQPRDGDAGGVRVLDTRPAATAALTASRLIISTRRALAGGITGVFNPVITPNGSKIVTAAWTGFLTAEATSAGKGHRDQRVSDHGGRRSAVESERARPERHLPSHSATSVLSR